MATIDRRRFLAALAATTCATRLRAQQQGGIAEHTTPAQAARPLSGRPYSTFVDVSAQAGFKAPTIFGGVTHKDLILEAVGCGCAFLDYDNDGWMDVLMLSGTRLQGDPPNATNRLYKNNRDGTFSDVTLKAGLQHTGWCYGVCTGDYNNDGFEDVFITAYGNNLLYRNNGDGTFTDVTKLSGLLGSDVRFGTGCSFLDYDRDGRLDLFVSNYVSLDLATAPRPSRGSTCMYKNISVNCGPRGLKAGRNSLYRNNGDGTFREVSKEAGLAGPNENYGLTVVSADFDEDGWPDIFVACDSTPSLLFMNNHDGTFREEALLRGVALSDEGQEQAGMGVGIGDYQLTGHLDLLKTHFMNDANGLYHNDGTGAFNDTTFESRLAVETRFVTWGAGIFDFDNDGWPDLFMTTGSVYPELEATFPEFPISGPRLLFRNLGNKTFEELTAHAGASISARHPSRGCAFGDFDNDGDVDILIMNQNEPPTLLRNDAPRANHWIKVHLEGTRSNRSAIGARVIVTYGVHQQAQAVVSQSSYLSANDPRLHFGLGESVEAQVHIFWPSGLSEVRKHLQADRLYRFREGAEDYRQETFAGYRP